MGIPCLRFHVFVVLWLAGIVHRFNILVTYAMQQHPYWGNSFTDDTNPCCLTRHYMCMDNYASSGLHRTEARTGIQAADSLVLTEWGGVTGGSGTAQGLITEAAAQGECKVA